MADNDEIHDEYQYTELDPLNPNVVEEEQHTDTGGPTVTTRKRVVTGESNVKRNAILAVLAFVGLMLGYKFIGSYLTQSSSSNIKPVVTATPISATPPIPITPVSPTPNGTTSKLENPPVPSTTTVAVPAPDVNSQLKSHLSTLAIGQENLNSQVSNFSSQISSLNSNITALTTKINDLTGIISSLSTKLESQAQIIERLSAKPAIKVVRHPGKIVRRIVQRFYIQAVIPGRAWLVASSGATLTVREGSEVPGYGHVTLIDPNQGRVLTSSGQIIRFSQNDS